MTQGVGERLNLVVFLLLTDDFLARVFTVRLDSQHGSILHPTNLEFHGHVFPFSDGRHTALNETFGLLVVDRQMNQINECGGGHWGVRFCA